MQRIQRLSRGLVRRNVDWCVLRHAATFSSRYFVSYVALFVAGCDRQKPPPEPILRGG